LYVYVTDDKKHYTQVLFEEAERISQTTPVETTPPVPRPNPNIQVET